MGARTERVAVLYRTQNKGIALIRQKSLQRSGYLWCRDIATYRTQRLQCKIGDLPIIRLDKALQMGLGIGYREVPTQIDSHKLQVLIWR